VEITRERVCSRCVCDTTIPGIEFDEHSICNFCHEYDERNSTYPAGNKGEKHLELILRKIRESGRGKEYDCVIGVSGGTDSTYCLYLAKKWNLRPLAVHFDNGWNSETAVSNIKKALTKLDIDLDTWVADWEEFKDLQIAFLKASVPDADIPTDIAIQSVLYKKATQEGIKYILNGSNFRTEGNQPPAWGYGDGKYILSVYKQYGKQVHLNNYPNRLLTDILWCNFIKKIRLVKPLYYVDYRKTEAMRILNEELGWQYYGGHHYENLYTRFVHGYYLPKKFGIDKRKIEYSALIRSQQMHRDIAKQKLQKLPYEKATIDEDLKYIQRKLDFTQEEFEGIMSAKPKMFIDYKTYYPIIMELRHIIGIAHRLNIYPDKIIGKYSYK